MRKFDILTPVGMVGGLGLVLYGISSGGGEGIKAFIDIPSLAITVGCSLFAVTVVYSLTEMKLLIKATIDAFFETKLDRLALVKTFEDFLVKSKTAGSLNAIEDDVDKLDDDFLKKGLELAISNADDDTIRMVLKAKMKEEQQNMLKGSKMYMTWGASAPAFGMVGTLIGLIQMMGDLGNPDDIASGMAKALITTFYGALFANLFLNPLGFNLKNKADKKLAYREMQITGILAVKNGDSKAVLQDKLTSYLTSEELIAYIGK